MPKPKQLGDKIAEMTLKQAKELSDYLKDAYGIEPAAGGGVMMAAPSEGGGAEAVEQTEFDVILTGFGDKKLNVVKVVKNLTGASLMEAKKMVESGSGDPQARGFEGRCRQDQGGSRRSRRQRRAEVRRFAARLPRCNRQFVIRTDVP